jgi:hypothetical protein
LVFVGFFWLLVGRSAHVGRLLCAQTVERNAERVHESFESMRLRLNDRLYAALAELDGQLRAKRGVVMQRKQGLSAEARRIEDLVARVESRVCLFVCLKKCFLLFVWFFLGFFFGFFCVCVVGFFFCWSVCLFGCWLVCSPCFGIHLLLAQVKVCSASELVRQSGELLQMFAEVGGAMVFLSLC